MEKECERKRKNCGKVCIIYIKLRVPRITLETEKKKKKKRIGPDRWFSILTKEYTPNSFYLAYIQTHSTSTL